VVGDDLRVLWARLAPFVNALKSINVPFANTPSALCLPQVLFPWQSIRIPELPSSVISLFSSCPDPSFGNVLQQYQQFLAGASERDTSEVPGNSGLRHRLACLRYLWDLEFPSAEPPVRRSHRETVAEHARNLAKNEALIRGLSLQQFAGIDESADMESDSFGSSQTSGDVDSSGKSNGSNTGNDRANADRPDESMLHSKGREVANEEEPTSGGLMRPTKRPRLERKATGNMKNAAVDDSAGKDSDVPSAPLTCEASAPPSVSTQDAPLSESSGTLNPITSKDLGAQVSTVADTVGNRRPLGPLGRAFCEPKTDDVPSAPLTAPITEGADKAVPPCASGPSMPSVARNASLANALHWDSEREAIAWVLNHSEPAFLQIYDVFPGVFDKGGGSRSNYRLKRAFLNPLCEWSWGVSQGEVDLRLALGEPAIRWVHPNDLLSRSVAEVNARRLQCVMHRFQGRYLGRKPMTSLSSTTAAQVAESIRLYQMLVNNATLSSMGNMEKASASFGAEAREMAASFANAKDPLRLPVPSLPPIQNMRITAENMISALEALDEHVLYQVYKCQEIVFSMFVDGATYMVVSVFRGGGPSWAHGYGPQQMQMQQLAGTAVFSSAVPITSFGPHAAKHSFGVHLAPPVAQPAAQSRPADGGDKMSAIPHSGEGKIFQQNMHPQTASVPSIPVAQDAGRPLRHSPVIYPTDFVVAEGRTGLVEVGQVSSVHGPSEQRSLAKTL
jgi:hypothetical protein